MTSPLEATFTLLRLPNVGVSTYWKLVHAFGSPEAALNAPVSEVGPYLKQSAINALTLYQANKSFSVIGSQVEEELDRLREAQIHLVDISNESYPVLLKETHNPPPLLYVRGDPQCLDLPMIAIVGSRNPSAGGRENAFEFARYLADAGFTIGSGLALGVDGAAHEGTLAAGGKTVAVLGTGIDMLYPPRHRSLALDIIACGGALVSEFSLGVKALPGNFPRRNRIISGLSLGILVIEAALKSGSLITARYGLQENREVFALPGSIHNPMSRGCHQLIREGAVLVDSANDIYQQLQGMLAYKQEESVSDRSVVIARSESNKRRESHTGSIPVCDTSRLNEDEKALLSCIEFTETSLDLLSIRSGLAISTVNACAVSLELQGWVKSTGSGLERLK